MTEALPLLAVGAAVAAVLEELEAALLLVEFELVLLLVALDEAVVARLVPLEEVLAWPG